MACWYTYPATESDSDTENDTLINYKTMEEIQEETTIENAFFEDLSRVPYLYKFANHSVNTNHWLEPIAYANPLDHFYDLVDQDTTELIKEGIPKLYGMDYRTFGTSSWDKDQLIIIFDFAKGWVALHGMGRNHYLNDVCWVAAKIIRFQIEDHQMKYPFKGVKFY